MEESAIGIYRQLKNKVPLSIRVGARTRLAILKSAPQGTIARVKSRFARQLPLPPARLIYLVSGIYDVREFCDGGASANQRIREILAKNGINFGQFEAILDFGCGVGRIIRHWDLNGTTMLFGTDYNSELINWCRKNLPVANFQINKLEATLEYDNEQFDFIYAWSVFTHLRETIQFQWINELARVLRPGGYLYLTTHGDHYLTQLSDAEREQYHQGHLVVLSVGRDGSNFCNAYHPVEYVRENFGRNFSIVDHVRAGAAGNSLQDVYLLQKL